MNIVFFVVSFIFLFLYGCAVETNSAASNNAVNGITSIDEASLAVTTQFISTWNTKNTFPGSSNSNQITLPLVSNGNYNFSINWGDGKINRITTWNAPAVTHTYAVAGTYTLKITGTIKGFVFNFNGDRNKLITISQWGPLNLGNNGYYFYGCSNLSVTASDNLDLTGTTDLEYAFAYCPVLTGVPSMNSWDVSKVKNMSGMFKTAISFSQNIGNWNVFNVTDMSFMFEGAKSFNQYIGNWNVSKVTNMWAMFADSNFNVYIGNWNVSNVTSMGFMFQYDGAFNQYIGDWNVSKVTDMSNMFDNATSFNQYISTWNVANVTSWTGIFSNCPISTGNKPPKFR
jgi:surface protein